MNLKLDVVRLANEDVITTSVECEHEGTWHLYITSVDETKAYGSYYNQQGTKMTDAFSRVFAAIDGTADINQWYYEYWDGSDHRYAKCNGNHNGYTK